MTFNATETQPQSSPWTGRIVLLFAAWIVYKVAVEDVRA